MVEQAGIHGINQPEEKQDCGCGCGGDSCGPDGQECGCGCGVGGCVMSQQELVLVSSAQAAEMKQRCG